MHPLILALLAAVTAMYIAYVIGRRRQRAKLVERLHATVRVLATQLGAEWELDTIEQGHIVLRSGERVAKIPVLLAIETVEAASASEMKERVNWLLRHAELKASEAPPG